MERNTHKIEIDRDFLINEYIVERRSPDQIAKDCGCSSSTVRLRIKEFKIPVRGRKESAEKANISELELKELYLNKRLSTREIAKVTGLGKSTIFSYIVKYNIQLRSKSEGNKGKIRTEEFRRKFSLSITGENNLNFGKHFSEEHKDKISKSNLGKKRSPETKRRISEAHLGKSLSQEHKNKIAIGNSGELCHWWRGGISFGKYCPKFNNLLKEQIRNRFGRICVICGTNEENNRERLSCHHVNFDKKSGCFGRKWNILPLCHKCHTWTTNHRRESFLLLGNWWAFQSNIILDSVFSENLTVSIEYLGLGEVL